MLLFVGITGLLLASQTDAKVKPPVEDDRKILICHRDNNVKKPYGPKADDPSISAILNEKGHSEHTGVIASSEAIAETLKGKKDKDDPKWGDIIPPFYYGEDGSLYYEGYNYTNIGKAMLENDCQYVTEVIPTAVTFEAPTCDARELYTYIIPAVDHVSYYLGDSETPLTTGVHTIAVGTSATIKAVVDKGYYLSGNTKWSDPKYTAKMAEECVLGDNTIIPTSVTFVAPTCDALGSYTIPALAGVEYSVDDVVKTAGTYSVANGTSVTIIATALEGYVLDGISSEWSYTFTAPSAASCVLGISTVVPIKVTFTAPTCSVFGTYTIPSITGVIYSVGGVVKTAGTYAVANGATVVVTAVATEGYFIENTVTSRWTYTFTTPSCGGNGSVLGTSTTATSLPLTSGDTTAANVTIFSLIAGAITIIGFAARSIFAQQF